MCAKKVNFCTVTFRSKFMTDLIYRTCDKVESFSALNSKKHRKSNSLLNEYSRGTREHFYARIPETMTNSGKVEYAVAFELPRDYIASVSNTQELQMMPVQSGAYAYFEMFNVEDDKIDQAISYLIDCIEAYDYESNGYKSNYSRGPVCLYGANYDQVINENEFHDDVCATSSSSSTTREPNKRKISIAVPVDLIETKSEDGESKPDYDNFTKSELYARAYEDQLTGLKNWNFMQRILSQVDEIGLHEYDVVHFDVKQFNMINAIFGYKVGDELLRKIGATILDCKDWVYYSARCDNDNFCLLTKPLSESELRTKLEELFAKINSIEETEYTVHYRAGATLCADIPLQTGRVIEFCRLAQKRGTTSDKTEINFYTQQMQEEYRFGIILKEELPRALYNEDLKIHYQPKVSILDQKIVGAEALVRWNFRGTRLLSPAQFIPFFEAEGKIDLIDQYVLNKVCQLQRQLLDEGVEVVPISVNISGVEAARDGYAYTLLNIIDKYGLSPNEIEFEITESVTLGDNKNILDFMHTLNANGYNISLDDFGTGYSSLRMLKDLPIKTVKIAKNFVDDLLSFSDNNKQLVLLEDIITLSKHIGIKCLAEGVEYYSQAEALRKFGCDVIQGYYYSMPIPRSDYIDILIKSEQMEIVFNLD